MECQYPRSDRKRRKKIPLTYSRLKKLIACGRVVGSAASLMTSNEIGMTGPLYLEESSLATSPPQQKARPTPRATMVPQSSEVLHS